MNASNLAAIFQPGLINHPDHDMSPGDYKLSQDVLVFLITNQDHFLLGMRGNAENEAVDNLSIPQVVATPSSPRRSKTLIDRSPSTSSAAADDIRKHGNLRRNVSVTSRRSTAGSPVVVSSGGGLGRSNTVPSKRSSAVPPVTFRGDHTPTPTSPRPAVPGKNSVGRSSSSTGGQVRENASHLASRSEASVGNARPAQPRLSTPPRAAPLPQEKNHEDPQAHSRLVTTPTKERNFAHFFSGLSPDSHDRLQRPGNKLRKKRITPNHSAESSTTTLPEGGNTSASVLALAQNGYGPPPTSHSVQSVQSVQSAQSFGPPPTSHSSTGASLESVPHPNPMASTTSMLNYFGVSQQGTTPNSAASSATLMPAMSPTPSTTSSVTSQSSSHEYSDTTNPSSSPEKKKTRSRWRLSGQRFDNPPTSPTFTNGHSSTGSLAERIRKVSQSPPHRTRSVSGETSGMSDSEEKRGAFGWLSKRVNDRKHNHQQCEQEKQQKEHEKQSKQHGRALSIREEMQIQIDKLAKPIPMPMPGSPRVQPPTPSVVTLPLTPSHEHFTDSPKERESNSFWRDRQVHRDYPVHSPRSSEEKVQAHKREGQQPLKRGSHVSHKSESQKPQRQEDEVRRQPRLEGQEQHRRNEVYHPHRSASQLPRRVEGQKPQGPEGQQLSKPESHLPRMLESQQPQRQEVQQPRKPESQQLQKLESLILPLEQESQQQQKLERQQQKPGSQQPNSPKAQQPHTAESRSPIKLETQQPHTQDSQITVVPESKKPQMPESQSPIRPEPQQSQVLEGPQPNKPESQQPHVPEPQLPHMPQAHQMLRRGSQQTHKQEVLPVPISELPLYAPVPGESIEPEAQGQGRRRPQAIRPGEPISMHEIPDGLMSPPGTAL